MAEGEGAKNVKGQLDVQDFKDIFLECPVCAQHFNQTSRRPRILNSCLHAFCTSCLQSLLTKEGGHKITCPLCRQVQTVSGNSDTLPIDPVRNKLTEYLHINIKKIFCTDCPDGNEAECRCQECSSYHCAACRSAHKRHRWTKDHRIITLDELFRDPQANFKRGHFCQYHPIHQIEFYCNTDEQLCCVSCYVVDHKDHEVIKLEKAAEAKTAILENKRQHISKMSVLTQEALRKEVKRKGTLTDISKENEDDINTLYNSLKNAVESERKRQLANFKQGCNQALATVQNMMTAHEQTMAKIEATLGYVSKLQETAYAVEMLQMYPSVMRNMDGITGAPVHEVIEVTNLRFKASATTLKMNLSESAHKAVAEVDRKKRKRPFWMAFRNWFGVPAETAASSNDK